MKIVSVAFALVASVASAAVPFKNGTPVLLLRVLLLRQYAILRAL